MAALQDRLIRLTETGQHAVAGAVRAWSGALERLASAVPAASSVVDSAFDTAELALRTQRDIAHGLLRMARGGR